MERNLLHEIVLAEADVRRPLKVPDVAVKPYRLGQIKLPARLCDSGKNLLRAVYPGISVLIDELADCVPAAVDHPAPKTKHILRSP